MYEYANEEDTYNVPNANLHHYSQNKEITAINNENLSDEEEEEKIETNPEEINKENEGSGELDQDKTKMSKKDRESLNSLSSQDSVDMVFPHLNKKNNSYKLGDMGPYSVSQPVKGHHVSYTVKGVDDDGNFVGSRRYNDFYYLRNALIARWPGVYFPPIPPKKKVGNKKLSFIKERGYFLQRFLSKMSLHSWMLG